ncbi:conserved domain protein [delta proteobacterium NaphS2]|nr:conserved domain protein [delta proteobacterium NaphS2]
MTIGRGKKELTGKADGVKRRIRKPGGGRKRLSDKNPALIKDLDMLIDPLTRGDPESPLRWTCKSTYKLSEALRKKGHNVSQKTVYLMLQKMGYSMQANRKVKEGKQNPDRDAQFNFILKFHRF